MAYATIPTAHIGLSGGKAPHITSPDSTGRQGGLTLRRTRIRLAVVLIGAGLGSAYLLSAYFLFTLLVSLDAAYGLGPAVLMVVPALLLSVVAAVAVSMPLQLLGAFLVFLGIRDEAVSPFWENLPENMQS